MQETGGAALYASLAYNSSLKELKIDSQWIPLEFKGKSLDEVRKFFADSAAGTTSVTSLRVMLVGFGGRGKTSLLQSLKKTSSQDDSQSPSDPPKATDGVEIHSWKLKDLQLSVWDFAGQEVCDLFAFHFLFFLI